MFNFLGESVVEVVTQKNRTENRNSITSHNQKHNVLNNHHGNHNGTHNSSHTNITNGTTVNGNSYTNGGSVAPQVNGKSNKENEIDNRKLDNNTKKFAFLSQPTIPDYRSQTVVCLYDIKLLTQVIEGCFRF